LTTVSFLKTELQKTIDDAKFCISKYEADIVRAERVVRMEILQKNYEDTYLKFIAEHTPPSEYESQISTLVKNIFITNRPDRDAILAYWQNEVVILKAKLGLTRDRLADMESVTVTKKPAKK